MPWLPDMLTPANVTLGVGSLLAKQPDGVPASLRSMQNALRQGSQASIWPLLAVVGGVVVAAVLLVVVQRLRALRPPRPPRQRLGDPERLFQDALARLDLSSADKALLREMTRGARLRHPTMALLTPKLLDWCRRVWLEEKGSRVVTPQKFQRIDRIAEELYRQPTPPRQSPWRFNQSDRPQAASPVELLEEVD